jgi:hypothetical protein
MGKSRESWSTSHEATKRPVNASSEFCKESRTGPPPGTPRIVIAAPKRSNIVRYGGNAWLRNDGGE